MPKDIIPKPIGDSGDAISTRTAFWDYSAWSLTRRWVVKPTKYELTCLAKKSRYWIFRMRTSLASNQWKAWTSPNLQIWDTQKLRTLSSNHLIFNPTKCGSWGPKKMYLKKAFEIIETPVPQKLPWFLKLKNRQSFLPKILLKSF